MRSCTFSFNRPYRTNGRENQYVLTQNAKKKKYTKKNHSIFMNKFSNTNTNAQFSIYFKTRKKKTKLLVKNKSRQNR